jgi:hypothetical protein
MVWCLTNGLGRRLAQHLGSFYHQIEVRQHIGRKVSIIYKLFAKELGD